MAGRPSSGRAATTAVIVVLAATSDVSVRGASATEPSVQERAAFDRVNGLRRERSLPPFRWDGVSHDELRLLARSGAALPPTRVYARVNDRRGHEASAAFHAWRGPDAAAQLEASPHVYGTHTHASVVLEGEGDGRTASLYLCRIPLPDSPTELRGPSPALHRCPVCKREWPRQWEEGTPPRLGCSHCDLLAGGYLQDAGGVERWATHYAQPWAPVAVDNPFLAWQWTNERIRYDHPKVRHNLPGWQTAPETAKLQTGVCRDTAVFLAAWLRRMKIDARVVTGFHENEGHAWVVMFDGETGYLLETAMDGTMSRRHPPRLELATDYQAAELMFDDRRVWLSRTGKRTRDYRSTSNWAETKEAR